MHISNVLSKAAPRSLYSKAGLKPKLWTKVFLTEKLDSRLEECNKRFNFMSIIVIQKRSRVSGSKEWRSRWLDILAKFSVWMFVDRDGVEVHKLGKKGTKQMPNHIGRTSLNWSIKDFYCFGERGWGRGFFSLETIPSGQDNPPCTLRAQDYLIRLARSRN